MTKKQKRGALVNDLRCKDDLPYLTIASKEINVQWVSTEELYSAIAGLAYVKLQLKGGVNN